MLEKRQVQASWLQGNSVLLIKEHKSSLLWYKTSIETQEFPENQSGWQTWARFPRKLAVFLPLEVFIGLGPKAS